MRPEHPSISRLLPIVLSAVAFANPAVPPAPASAATYDYAAPQVAPSIAVNLGMAEIAAILNETAPNPPYRVAYQLTTTDANNKKASLAPLKVVPTNDPDYPYFRAFHTRSALPNSQPISAIRPI